MRLLLLCALLAPPAAAAAGPRPLSELVDRTETLLRGKTVRSTLEMAVVTPSWQRSMTLRTVERTPDLALIRIVAPSRDMGAGTLKRGQQLWNYIPNINRVMKVPPSLMTSSWMGSDFTNDDVARETSLKRDFTIAEGEPAEVDGKPARRAILVPKPDVPIAYAKLELLLRETPDGAVPLVETYFDEAGEKVRELRFEDWRPAPGRALFPYRWTMLNLSKPGHRTTIVVREIAFDEPVDEGTFTLQSLQRGGTR